MEQHEDKRTKPAVLETKPETVSIDQALSDTDLDNVSGGGARRRVDESYNGILGRGIGAGYY